MNIIKWPLLIVFMLMLLISCVHEPNDPEEKGNLVIDFVTVPAGNFIMGNTGIFLSNDYELPAHKVYITKPFLISKYEITQAQWKGVMGQDNNPSINTGNDLPVENICWYQALDFCNRLSVLEGLTPCYKITQNEAQGLCDLKTTAEWNREANGYRLPTEAEWEYVCKAGSQTDFCIGNLVEVDCNFLDSNLNKVGWYCNNSGRKTQKVGQKSPNAFGVYDIHGNVFEWCWDIYGKYPSGTVINPTGLANGDIRAIRGGGGFDKAAFSRSSFRAFSGYPYDRNGSIGIRIVRYAN